MMPPQSVKHFIVPHAAKWKFDHKEVEMPNRVDAAGTRPTAARPDEMCNNRPRRPQETAQRPPERQGNLVDVVG